MSEWLLSTLLIVGRSGVGQAGTASDDSLRRSTAFAIGLQRKLRHNCVLIPDGKSYESLYRLPDGYSVPRLLFRGYILPGSFFPAASRAALATGGRCGCSFSEPADGAVSLRRGWCEFPPSALFHSTWNSKNCRALPRQPAGSFDADMPGMSPKSLQQTYFLSFWRGT